MSSATHDAFRPPRWLRGAHAQTIVPALIAPRLRVAFRRERWATPDGDFLDVDRAGDRRDGDRIDDPRPMLVVFHGLEGSSASRYVRGLIGHGLALGWSGVAPHYRGCSGTLNQLPRFYHSGDSDEIDWILRRLVDERGGRPLHAVGVSLGGNMLLKWLGERGDDAKDIVAAAAAISAPMDLMAGGHALGRGFNRAFYGRMFLRTLKAKSLAKLAVHDDLYDRRRVRAAKDLHEFDGLVTAPLHGFRDTEDYWTRASSKPWLARIAVPTLILNARNDPFMPAAALPRARDVSSSVTLEQPDEGGHVGFVHRGRAGSHWMPRRVLRFLMSSSAKTWHRDGPQSR